MTASDREFLVQKLGNLLQHVLVEIRNLSYQEGHARRINDLTDLTHNIPEFLLGWNDYVLDYLRDGFLNYAQKYQPEIDPEKSRYVMLIWDSRPTLAEKNKHGYGRKDVQQLVSKVVELTLWPTLRVTASWRPMNWRICIFVHQVRVGFFGTRYENQPARELGFEECVDALRRYNDSAPEELRVLIEPDPRGTASRGIVLGYTLTCPYLTTNYLAGSIALVAFLHKSVGCSIYSDDDGTFMTLEEFVPRESFSRVIQEIVQKDAVVAQGSSLGEPLN